MSFLLKSDDGLFLTSLGILFYASDMKDFCCYL